MMTARPVTALCLIALWALMPAEAQELDLDYMPARPLTPIESIGQPDRPAKPTPSTSLPGGKPLSITVTKTLYLPPAMYGQWSVTGTLLETNISDFFKPVVTDIWILERQDDQVIITNPANGASATINVDAVEGNRATFHRQGPAGRNRFYQEIPTITVDGDVLFGRTINKLIHTKDGRVTKEYYGVYQLEARRISSGRVQFRPEASEQGPDFEIAPVQVQR